MMQGHRTTQGLWLPGERKRDGGTWFDDELDTEQRALVNATAELVRHINQRPDHVVYVSSTSDREKMRAVFDWMLNDKLIGRKPKIKIEYGLRDGEVRVAP
jgi:alkylhydroperoxidase family enzyme